MAELSTMRKVALGGRVLGNQIRKSRFGGAILRGAAAAWRPMRLALRQLWHQVTGFVFLCFAVAGALALFREIREPGADHEARLITATAFTLIFCWFGFSSLWRAKKI